MEQQNLITQIYPKLKQKSNENITYRKALAIYESLIESTTAIPNYKQNIANTQTNFALFVFGSVYKLLSKARKSANDKYNIDAYILLMGLTVNKVNMSTLLVSNLLQVIQNQVFEILLNGESAPLTIRHSISILNYSLNATLQSQKTSQQAMQIITRLFEIAIQNPRNNILSKESSKLLSLIVRNNINVGKLLGQEVKKNLLQNLDSRQQLYLNNVREVIAQFPIPLINDIIYRTTKNLVDVDHENQANENYLSQLYFMIEKLIEKLSVSTLEEIIKQLLENIPTSNDSEKVIFCYLQALYELIIEFMNKNTKYANKYLSSVISIFQQFLLMGGKVSKHSFGLFKYLMKNGIRSQLWQINQDNNDMLNIDEINLQENSKESHEFGKVICMLKSMLSNRFPNTKQTAGVFCEFFQSLDQGAFEYVQEVIIEIVNFRDQFDDKFFKRVMHSIFIAFSPKRILEMYRPTIKGDIANESFQTQNNLWILGCLEKYQGEEQIQVFGLYFVPLLAEIKNITSSPNLTKVRKQAFISIADNIWHGFKVFCKAINKRSDYESLFSLIDSHINQVNESILDHISVGLERLCLNLYKNEYHSKISENLIKHFASTLDIEKNNSKQILQAIKSLSLITDRDYLNRVFEKNIVKLLQACEKGTIASEKTIDVNLKNLQILMSVCSGLDFNDPTVLSSYRISKEQLVLKLTQYLISQKNIFQKKGYKFILQTINVMPESFIQQIIDIIQNDEKVLPASKHYRIAILYQLWQKISIHVNVNDESQRNVEKMFSFIKAYQPEILIALKEPNKRARKQATRVFEEFYTKLHEMGLVQNYIQIICAGFTSQRTEIKVATIYGLAQIMTKKDLELEKSFLNEVFELVVLLLKEKKHQIYKAVIDFSKKYVLKLDKSQQLLILPGLLTELFTVDEQSRMQERSILKFFLLRLVKRHQRDVVQKMIPESDRKILSNAIKVENRLKKKKREQNQMRRQELQRLKKAQKHKSTQQGQDQSSSSQQSVQVDHHNNEMLDEGQQQQDKLQALDNNTDNLLLKYDLQKQNFHFEQKKLNILNQQRNLRKQKEQQKNQDVVFDQDGFMIVRDDNKRRRRDQTNDENEMKEEDNQVRQQFVNVKKRIKTDNVHQVKESGESFRSNRAGGDVRRKDQPQPYAFIQFNSKALNKRFKKKAQKIFDTIFQRKQGGLKGIKSRVLTKSN